MSKEKHIEEMDCKNCIHYEVCMYVNAQAVEYARAENCKLFKNNAGYRKQIDGEWIDMDYYIHNKRIYKCSECSNSETKDTLTSANYCPNCGAKMKGGAE